jgi:type IV secretion system protein VirB11
MAVAIRKHVAADLSLEGYQATGAFAQTRRGDTDQALETQLARHYNKGDWPAFLRGAVRARKTIMVAGGTWSGKTTFLNALLKAIEPDERLILIEDTPELVCDRGNWVGLVAVRGSMGEAQVNADDLLSASLRMRPERIILGELRGSEAFTFLRSVNTGHPGSLTTIHAGSPDRAVEQLGLLVQQAGTALSKSDIADYIRMAVDIFVQLERRDGVRSVSEVRWTRASH